MELVEFSLISRADISTVLSEEEFSLLKPHFPEKKLKLLPFSRSMEEINVVDEVRDGLFFIGGFNHAPNIDGICYFVEEVMPILRLLLPNIKLYIVGSNPVDKIFDLASNDIEVLGYVEDLSPLLKKVKISIAPLRYGAGIKGKVASSLASGVPVVGTSIAAEGMGLDNMKNILIADTPDEFASAIEKLYLDKGLWKEISQNGLHFAQQKWGYESAIKNLMGILKDLDLDVNESNEKFVMNFFGNV
jgi:glycosyltransferase involved in cell wall biosynthesis